MSTNIQTSGQFGLSHDDHVSLGSNGSDLDIDFSMTESGRTVAHFVSHLNDDHMNSNNVNDDNNNLNNLNNLNSVISVIDETDNFTLFENSTTSCGQQQPLRVKQEDSQDLLQHRHRSQPKAIPQMLKPAATRGRGSSFGSLSESAFLSGIMSHTPPSAMTPSSYEVQHFGKRMRSGSISERLKSAKELEDLGLIDCQQKGVLKDLIISGDEVLQSALEKFETGDTETLENMIRNGALSNKASEDIDLLGELDLDFLTVEDEYAAAAMEAATKFNANENEIGSSSTDDRTSHAPAIHPARNFPTKRQVQKMTLLPNADVQPNMVSPSLRSVYEEDDGIGDLDFNADFAAAETDDEPVQLPPPFGQGISGQGPSPNLLQEQQRFRSNSLAFGALFSENTSNSGDAQEVYGRWMDRQAMASSNETAALHAAAGTQNIMQDANGGLYILNPSDTGTPSTQITNSGSGIGESLAQYGRSKSDSKLKTTKKVLAEERRREKLEKKEQKEKDKRAKKERRECEMKEKKERDARDKMERKEKKVAALKAKQDKQEQDDEERKETPSGLGRPRSMSDPNLKFSTDVNGLMQVERPDGWIGAYSPESRKMRIDRFLEKRNHRVWTKTVKYDVRKNFADSRLRVKGRFVKKEDELLMRDLMSLT